MQKKELRKSWRRKLAGLLAGTLIAGVFGISMPMTAKAADPVLALSQNDFTGVVYKEQAHQTAELRIDITNSGEEPFTPTANTIEFSGGADSAFKFIGGETAEARTVIQGDPVTYENGTGYVTIGLVNDLAKFADGKHSETIRFVKSGATSPIATREISVTFATTTYGIDAYESNYPASATTEYDFGSGKVGSTPAQTGAGLLYYEFELRNEVDAPVSFSQLSVTTPQYFTVTGMPTSGGPFSKGKIADITITPKTDKATDGPVTEDITFSVKDQQNQVKASVTIHAKVEVQPLERKMAVTSGQKKLNFGTGNTAVKIDFEGNYSQPTAILDTQNVTLERSGDLDISGVRATTDSTGVDVKIDGNKTTINDSNPQLTVKVTPKTKLTAGDYSGNLTISATGVDDIVIPIEFELVDCDYTVEVTDDPTTSGVKPVAVTEIAFDERGEGYTDVQTKEVTLTLKGDTKVTGTAKIVDAAGKAYDKFEVDPKDSNKTIDTELGVTDGKVIYVVKPAATLTEGDYSGKLVFDFVETDDIEIPLSFSVKKGTYTFDVQDVTDSKNPKNITEHDFGKKVENGYKFTTIAEAQTDDTLTADEIAINIKNTGNSPIYVKATVTETSTEKAFAKLKNDLEDALDGTSSIAAGETTPALNWLPDAGTPAAPIKPGTYTATVKLESYAPNAAGNGPDKTKVQATKTLTFTFEVEEEKVQITVTPRSYDFGGVPEGFTVGKEVKAKTITVKNTGNKDVKINTLTSKWALENGDDVFTFDKSSMKTTTLKVGESATVTIVPKNQLPGQQQQKPLTYDYTPGADNSYSAVYSLKAEGINEDTTFQATESNEVRITAAFLLEAPEKKIEAVTKSVDMKLFANATQAEAEAQEKEVTIKNTGNVAVTMAPIRSGNFYFVELPDVIEVDAGATFTFKVRPRAGIASGTQKAKLTVNFVGANPSVNEALEIPVTLTITNSGWRKQEDGKWFFYKDGAAAKGWLKTGGKWYFLDKSTGEMKTGWLKDGGKWYYLKASGAMANNEWIQSNGKWYHMDKYGVMETNAWAKSNGKWYHVDKYGVMQTNAWVKSNGKWYYVKGDGAMAANETLTIKSKSYKFDKNGVCTNP